MPLHELAKASWKFEHISIYKFEKQNGKSVDPLKNSHSMLLFTCSCDNALTDLDMTEATVDFAQCLNRSLPIY